MKKKIKEIKVYDETILQIIELLGQLDAEIMAQRNELRKALEKAEFANASTAAIEQCL